MREESGSRSQYSSTINSQSNAPPDGGPAHDVAWTRQAEGRTFMGHFARLIATCVTVAIATVVLAVSPSASAGRPATSVVSPASDPSPIADVTAQFSRPSPFSVRGRESHSTVWTGKEMIVWGGTSNFQGYLADGAIYNAETGIWRPVSTRGQPHARAYHTAVWTGSEMIVWGGGFTDDHKLMQDGARYNPDTDTWFSVSTVGAPSEREYHTAVWTGKEMLIWGGGNATGLLNDGAAYDPTTDTWRTISPVGLTVRHHHSAIWTGIEMIVWGGIYDTSTQHGPVWNDGARYNPETDQWTLLSADSAPPGRYLHTATWVSHTMVVWGGLDLNGNRGDGARYNLASNEWSPLPSLDAPATRPLHAAVAIDNSVAIWGRGTVLGDPGAGAVYDPLTDVWHPITATAAPVGRTDPSAVWTGSQMLIWGGYAWAGDYPTEGGTWDPASDTWTRFSGEFPTYWAFLPSLARGYVSFVDDFSDPRSGWPIEENPVAAVGYSGGEYRILVKEPGYLVTVGPGLGGECYSLQADARAVDSLGGTYGLYFTRSAAGLYLLEISPSVRQYMLSKYDSGRWTTVLGPAYSSSISPGTQSNRLKVVRANGGQDIFMYINGTYVNRISDYYMVGGTVGLAATSSASNFDARFDNFTFDNECPSLSTDSITSAAATTSPSDAEIAIVPLSREQHR